MATVASSIAASEGPPDQLDKRIETFVTGFTEMAKKRFTTVERLRKLFSGIEAIFTEAMKPKEKTDRSKSEH